MQSNNLPYNPSFDVPAADFKNWAGGFSDITAANFASSGGIPITGIISGGQISKVRLEHIWVEAAIDYLPSRGAKNRDADSWVEMDPSYKQYDYKKGLDAVAISGIDPEQLAQSFIDSGTVNESEGWVTGFDAGILQTAKTEAQQKLEAYIQNNLTNPTVGDVIGGRQTIVKEYPVLPSSLPNKIVVTGSRYDKLPGQLQQKITWAFSKDLLGDLVNPVSFPFAKVNNQKISAGANVGGIWSALVLIIGVLAITLSFIPFVLMVAYVGTAVLSIVKSVILAIAWASAKLNISSSSPWRIFAVDIINGILVTIVGLLFAGLTLTALISDYIICNNRSV